MHIPWWKRLDITQAAVAIMTLKVLLPLSILIRVPDIVDNALLCISLFLLLFSFESRLISSVKLFFTALILCVIAAYTCLVIDDFSILITVLSLAVLCFYDTRTFIRMIFWVSAIFCAVHIIASSICFLCGYTAPLLLYVGSGNIFNFGTVHPNTFSALFSSLTLMFLWLYGDKNRGLKLLVCLALQIAVYFLTDARTPLLINIFTLVMLVWSYYRPPKKLLQAALCTVIPLLTIFMFVMVNLYIQGHPFAIKVNSILNSRVVLGACAYDHFGLTVFGKYIPFHKQALWDPKWLLTTFTFDNMYSYLMVQGGVFWIAVLSWCFIVASRRLNTKDMVFLLTWALYGMCENTILNGYTMFPIFLLANACRHKASLPAKPRRFRLH